MGERDFVGTAWENSRIKNDIELGGVRQQSDHFEDGHFADELVLCRKRDDYPLLPPNRIDYMDVAPEQLVSIAAALIPFLEHDDANRALMGSNMQRQAVPLLVTEPPIVGTGLERDVALHSGMIVRAGHKGTVTYADAERIEIGPEVHRLRKFVGLNERTCQNQKPIVKVGDKVEKGQVIADGAATYQGELALGRNVLVAFMSWEGFNFEDAIIISEELVRNDTYTSIHIEEFDIEIRETKLGKEEFTRDIPNVSPKALANLDEHGVVQIGTYVRPGDILVGKVSPKSRSELTPEEKLLHAIFGRAGEDVKNDSLEVQSGTEGIVIAAHRFEQAIFEMAAQRVDRLFGELDARVVEGRDDAGDTHAVAEQAVDVERVRVDDRCGRQVGRGRVLRADARVEDEDALVGADVPAGAQISGTRERCGGLRAHVAETTASGGDLHRRDAGLARAQPRTLGRA